MSGTPFVIFGPEIWSLQNEGGISRYFQELIKGLSKNGIGGEIFAQSNSNERFEKLESPNFAISILNDARVSSNQINQLLDSTRHGAIFHPTYYSRNHKNIARKIPRVITVFDMISELYPEKKPRFRKVIDDKRISIQNSDLILSISEQTRNDLIHFYGIPKDRILVTYLGSNLHLLPTANDAREIKSEYILYVGKRDGYKNFSNFVTAYSHSKSLKENFLIVAIGGGEFTPSELFDFQKLGISNNVTHVDANDKQLAMYYRNAACLVYPSLYEGFGLPPVEAMSLNCVVIGSTGGSIPEICKNAAQYFDPTSIDSIEHVVSTTLSDVQKMEHMRKLGQKVAESFTWEKTASDTLEAYKSLIR
jgi:glycosyltransferase involved in cell wall biosynthesis